MSKCKTPWWTNVVDQRGGPTWWSNSLTKKRNDNPYESSRIDERFRRSAPTRITVFSCFALGAGLMIAFFVSLVDQLANQIPWSKTDILLAVLRALSGVILIAMGRDVLAGERRRMTVYGIALLTLLSLGVALLTSR